MKIELTHDEAITIMVALDSYAAQKRVEWMFMDGRAIKKKLDLPNGASRRSDHRLRLASRSIRTGCRENSHVYPDLFVVLRTLLLH